MKYIRKSINPKNELLLSQQFSANLMYVVKSLYRFAGMQG
jgi:hypothetical protein